MLFRFFINDNDDKNVLQILLENVLESKFKNFLIWIDKNKWKNKIRKNFQTL